MGGYLDHAPRMLELARRTVASDCNDDEFRLFIHTAKSLDLDPLRKQLYAFVFNKNDPQKRRMSIVMGIDGARRVAARSGKYRPDENVPTIEYDENAKGPNNPLGIVRAVVRVYKQDGLGAWHPIAGEAYWDEFAPLKEVWERGEDGKRHPTGRVALDATGKWATMGRVMIAKCAEMQALRRGWPDDLSNVYEQAEIDQAKWRENEDAADPVALANDAAVARRQAALGGPSILMAFDPMEPLQAVPVGKFYDRVVERLSKEDASARLSWFESVNKEAFRQFWSHEKDAALALKKLIEDRRTALAKADQDFAKEVEQ